VGKNARKRSSDFGAAKTSRKIILLFWTVIFWTVSPAAAQQSEALRASQIAGAYSKLPISFEPNHGQTDARVNFLARGSGYVLLLTPSGATLSLSGTGKASPSRMTIKVVRGNPAAQAEGLDALPGKSNYLLGNDRSTWRTNVANYAKVKYRNVYRGVDLVYYGNQRQLEYDLVASPGADPSVIQLAFDGVQSMRIGPEGDLVLRVPAGEIRQHKPVLYQEADGIRRSVEGRYVRKSSRSIGFHLGTYDASRPLVIDPRLNYSTFLGGKGNAAGRDQGLAIAVDSSGSAYVTGGTQSPDFPVKGAVQPAAGGGLQSVFVTKLNASGTALVYSTYLGGSGTNYDEGRGIAVDSSGNAYVTGRTFSKNFPVTPGAFQTVMQAGGAVFVTKLNAAGDGLLYSTYLGGTGKFAPEAVAIALDSSGNAYVTGDAGQESDFPITLGAFQTSFNSIFVSKLNPAASGTASLVYSTFFGKGGGYSASHGIAVDSSGNAYITGLTGQAGIATTGAYQTSPAALGDYDVFVTKFNAAGSALIYSTYLGGSGTDVGNGIAIDAFGNAYVTGNTTSMNFPITPGAFQISFQGGFNNAAVFVTKLNASGDGLVYSTYLAGSGTANNTNHGQGNGIAVDYAGNAYVTGSTNSTSFPITPDGFRSSLSIDVKTFVAKLSVAGDRLVYSTYLAGDFADTGYGIAVDAVGNAYVTGYSTSPNFPVTPGAFQTTAACCSGKAFVTAIAADTGVALTQTGFTFQAVQNGGAPSPKIFRFFNATSRALNFTVATSTLSGGSWLNASPGNGSINPDQPASVNVSVNPAGLSPGDYYGQVRIDAPGAPNSPEFLTVVLNVSPPGTNPGPVVEPTGLVFVGLIGATTPAAQSVRITNLTNHSSSFTVVGTSTSGPNWFTISPASGTIAPNQPVNIKVQPNSGLSAGVYRGSLVLQFPQENASRTVDLLLVVTTVLNPSSALEPGLSTPAATATCAATKLLPVFTTLGANFNAPASWPAAIDVNVTDDCGSPVRTGSVVTSFSNGDPPLNLVSQQDGHWSATWAPLNARTNSMVVTVTAQQSQANLQGTIQIGGNVPDNPGIPALGALVSAGSFTPMARPSPGELVSIFGINLADGIEFASTLPLKTQMQGTLLVFGGRPLPLLYTNPNQVNAMLPYGITPGTTYQLIVTRGNRLSVPQSITVAAAEPAIFADSSGQGDVFVYRSATEQVLAAPGQPAKAGDILIIYCAGLGPVNPLIDAGVAVDRLIQTMNSVGLTIGGVQAHVVFSGLTGGLTGLYQINATMPDGVTPGDAVAVVLTVGNVASPPVSMAVR
jgi:uncharacterized protein (TIGR03437 family)